MKSAVKWFSIGVASSLLTVGAAAGVSALTASDGLANTADQIVFVDGHRVWGHSGAIHAGDQGVLPYAVGWDMQGSGRDLQVMNTAGWRYVSVADAADDGRERVSLYTSEESMFADTVDRAVFSTVLAEYQRSGYLPPVDEVAAPRLRKGSRTVSASEAAATNSQMMAGPRVLFAVISGDQLKALNEAGKVTLWTPKDLQRYGDRTAIFEFQFDTSDSTLAGKEAAEWRAIRGA